MGITYINYKTVLIFPIKRDSWRSDVSCKAASNDSNITLDRTDWRSQKWARMLNHQYVQRGDPAGAQETGEEVILWCEWKADDEQVLWKVEEGPPVQACDPNGRAERSHVFDPGL